MDLPRRATGHPGVATVLVFRGDEPFIAIVLDGARRRPACPFISAVDRAWDLTEIRHFWTTDQVKSTDEEGRTLEQTLSAAERLSVRPAKLLTQNSNLRRDRILNWSLPAWAGRFADGRTYNACPSAGICARVCFGRNGTYWFPTVLERHQRNLAYVIDNLPGWTAQMIAEIRRKRGRTIIRVHDIGDYFSDDYLRAWLVVMAACPQARFYSYTKEVDRFRRLVKPDPPANFAWLYSYGGTQDVLLNELLDQVADVFPTAEALRSAGYNPQSASDLLAVDGPAPVGIVANNIARFRSEQGLRTFRSWQAEADGRRPARRHGPTREASTKAPTAGLTQSA